VVAAKANPFLDSLPNFGIHFNSTVDCASRFTIEFWCWSCQVPLQKETDTYQYPGASFYLLSRLAVDYYHRKPYVLEKETNYLSKTLKVS
jgi:hypothetical protein